MTALDGGGFGGAPRLGSMFGRYRLESVLGRGGMGVVFLATDMELERPVALKFLAPDLAHDPAFRERFVRESRLAAAIEHPNIVPIYEAGAESEALYIAMRFVPGRDLGEVLRAERTLAFERTAEIGRSLADALDAAHRRGLIHRDVKPGNVLVEAETGRAFLVDFGLTRRAGETAVTVGGLLGTLDYMAPEQIEGGHLDGRADQYSLACLLFHCLAGRPPFERDAEAATLYAHVHAPPPGLAALRPDLGGRLDAVLARGMAKDADARFPDCRAFVAALASAAGRAEIRRGRGPRSTLHGRRARRLAPVAAAVAGAVGIIALLLALASRPGTPAPSVDPGLAGVASGASSAPGPTDPDGSPQRREAIVFASKVDGDYDIYRIGPDGKGQRPLTVSRRNERGVTVTLDGTRIAFAVGSQGDRDLWVMEANGGNPAPLTTGPADDHDPAWSPDGRSLAFTSDRDGGQDIFVMGSDENELSDELLTNVTNLTGEDEFAAWSPDGRRLAFSTNHWGGGRDLAVIRLRDPGNVDLWTTDGSYDLNPAWSPDGSSIVFARGPHYFDRHLFVIDADDRRATQLTDGPDEETGPSYSPDGRSIVFRRGPFEDTELWILDLDTGRERRLTRSMANALYPVWGTLVDD